jgi:methionyl-tRNA formyltransferase
LSDLIYFGTPEFSAQILEFLIDQGMSIVAVVTQPDRPKGRSLQMAISPVKELTVRRLPSVPIFQPERCSNPEFLEQIAALKADLYVVVAFGQILPSKLLQIPPLGCINVHPSLLPQYRGAAPIQRALMDGQEVTGVSIQKMVKELDAGDVILAPKMEIPEEMIFGELEPALCELSKITLLEVIQLYRNGVPEAVPQDPAGVTYASKITPEETQLQLGLDVKQVYNRIRALSPKPGAWVWAFVNGEKKRLKILRAKVVSSSETLSTKELILPCGTGFLHVLEVQPEGKSKMKASDWLRGARTLPKFS